MELAITGATNDLNVVFTSTVACAYHGNIGRTKGIDHGGFGTRILGIAAHVAWSARAAG
jgi:hypothetical protein